MELSLSKLKQNEKLQYWYEEILEKEKSGMSVSAWCTNRPYAVSTYYKHQKLVKEAIDAKLKERSEEVEFVPIPTAIKPISNQTSTNKIIIRQSNLELEIPDGTSRETILSLLEGLKC